MPVFPCELNFNHMSYCQGNFTLHEHQARDFSKVLCSYLCPLSFICPFFPIFCIRFPLQRNPWQVITAGCNYSSRPWLSQPPNPSPLRCRAEGFTQVELPDINGLWLNLNRGLAHGNEFCYQLSLQASQR